MGRIEAICVSERKGERKHPVAKAFLRTGYGIEGDAHAGPWHRQVSLLAAEDVEQVRRKLPEVGPGAFAENLIVSGIALDALGPGSRLRVGSGVILRITQLGKVCHNPCRIYHLTGDCIMPRLGLFARVETGGELRPGDPVELIETVERERIQAVVLTISDTCARGEAEDTAGPGVAARLTEAAGAHIYAAEILPDERDTIADRLRHYADGHSIDLVVTVGGTGFSDRDTTPEATREVVDRPTPGLDEAMRAASLAKTPHAMLSRGASGIRGATLIVNLPGSRRAALENLDVLLPALPHGIGKLRGDRTPCAAPESDPDA
jgi:molybdenum cofactor synthesis domain-containing protein